LQHRSTCHPSWHCYVCTSGLQHGCLAGGLDETFQRLRWNAAPEVPESRRRHDPSAQDSQKLTEERKQVIIQLEAAISQTTEACLCFQHSQGCDVLSKFEGILNFKWLTCVRPACLMAQLWGTVGSRQTRCRIDKRLGVPFVAQDGKCDVPKVQCTCRRFCQASAPSKIP
jgi:hypothetical protein